MSAAVNLTPSQELPIAAHEQPVDALSIRNVAVVITTRWWPWTSIDFGGYCQALARLGHSPALVCCGNDRPRADFPVVETSLAEMKQPNFWRSLKLEAVIFFNWLRAPRIVRAAKQGGLFVISRGDTDGKGSGRVFPKAAWLAMEASDDRMIVRLRKAKYLVQRYLKLSIAEDQDLIRTIELSDAVAIECDEAAKNLRRILAYYKRSDLGAKIHVIPHSVSDEFLSHEVSAEERSRTIICGGRWNDPQKDPHLLAATLKRLLQRQPELNVVIIGDGPNHLFERLTQEHSRIRWLRQVPREKVPELLSNARIALSSSRWEGYSIFALEALCMGCTLVGPPLPGFISMTEQGRYGTISSRRSPAALTRAAENEIELWDAGSRAPTNISPVWRGRVSNDSVVSNLISLIR
jgi:glycosyltransferase involved in cell wall biosynthesis